MFGRYAVAAGAAALTTFGLLLMMSQLIASGQPVRVPGVQNLIRFRLEGSERW